MTLQETYDITGLPSYREKIEIRKNPINVENLFLEEEDAIFTLFEELFESAQEIDRKRIYDSIKYLLWQKGMIRQYEEIIEMDETGLCVEHINKARDEVKTTITRFKQRILEFIEED